MADLWTEILQECKLGGIELPLASRSLRGGFAFARQKYPYRAGQETEDTGREPLQFDLVVPMYDGMQPAGLYPARYEELLFLLVDSGRAGEVEYVDPVLGPYDVKVASFDVREEAEPRDGALVSIQLEERIADDEALRFTLSAEQTGSRSRAVQLAEAADAQLEELGVPREDLDQAFRDAGYPLEGDELDWPDGELLSSGVDAAFGALDAGAATATSVAAQVSRFTARVDSVASIGALAASDAWATRGALLRLRESFTRAAEQVASSSRRQTLFTTQGATNLYRLCLQLYGDARHVDALARINNLANPLLIPAGSRLRVWVP